MCFVGIMDGHDIGVVEPSRRLGLVHQAVSAIWTQPSDSRSPMAPAPEPVDTTIAPLPTIIETYSADAPETVETPDPVEAPSSDDTPNAIIRADGGESEFFRPVDEIGNIAPNVETDRLPRIGTTPEVEAAPEPDAIVDVAPEAPRVPLEGSNALVRWATDFVAPTGRPLMSLVLACIRMELPQT